MSDSVAVASSDAKTVHTLTCLLEKATDKHETHPSPAVLKAIRDICKESDVNISWIAGVLLHRLSDEHAQVDSCRSSCVLQRAGKQCAPRMTLWSSHMQDIQPEAVARCQELTHLIQCRQGCML